MPNVAVTSRDMGVKKIIFAVWVRERPDPMTQRSSPITSAAT